MSNRVIMPTTSLMNGQGDLAVFDANGATEVAGVIIGNASTDASWVDRVNAGEQRDGLVVKQLLVVPQDAGTHCSTPFFDDNAQRQVEFGKKVGIPLEVFMQDHGDTVPGSVSAYIKTYLINQVTKTKEAATAASL